MKMDVVAGSGKDEYYTPAYAIRPLIKYLERGSTVWCPFDTEQSFYVRILREQGFRVVATHLEGGWDFFETDVVADYIVSNPPYSIKTEVLEDLFSRGVPFAMLVGAVGLFESQRRFEMFRKNKFELMQFNRRVSYFLNYDDDKPAANPPFSSVYVCCDVLPAPTLFEELDKADLKP